MQTQTGEVCCRRRLRWSWVRGFGLSLGTTIHRCLCSGPRIDRTDYRDKGQEIIETQKSSKRKRFATSTQSTLAAIFEHYYYANSNSIRSPSPKNRYARGRDHPVQRLFARPRRQGRYRSPNNHQICKTNAEDHAKPQRLEENSTTSLKMASSPLSSPSSRSSSPDRTHRPQPDLELKQEQHARLSLTTHEATSEISLSERLDNLLQSYLSLLDTYTTLRTQLSQELGAGFLALAQANRHCTLGPGRRYGEEGFDGRMKAGKKVEVEAGLEARSGTEKEGEGEAEKSQNINKDGPAIHSRDSEVISHAKRAEDNADALEDGPTRNKQASTSDEEPPPSLSNPTKKTSHLLPLHTITVTSTPQSSLKDPLKWYGILTPPSLRSCQGHFSGVISTTIPSLLNTRSAMQRLENEVWEVRRALKILVEYDYDEDDKEKEDEVVASKNDEEDSEDAKSPLHLSSLSLSSVDRSVGKNQLSHASMPKSKSSSLLPSSPTELRSRVLKLD